MFKAGLLFFTALAFPALSKACITAPFSESWQNGGSVTWGDGPGDCILNASVGAPRPSAATVHFRRASPQLPLRISFVVDPHLTSLTISQFATLASGVAAKVPVAGPDKASLFEVSLLYGGGGIPRIGIAGACHQAAVPQGECGAALPVSFADFPLRITLDVHMGAGSAGQIQAWLGDDVSGAPALSLDDLDNERWEGIDRVSVGLSGVSESLFATIGTQPFTFSEISVSDPQLFWNGFESDVVGSVVPNASNLFTVPLVIAGTTCGGSVELPVIASGSTRLGGPTAIHPITVPAGNQRWVQLSSASPFMSIFACPIGSGPSGPCIDAKTSSGTVYLPEPGSYQVVVGSLQQECGAYDLIVGGTLGDMH
ncbi:hypothetical protein [Dokdonella sp.]|uniref:hypothetical protein n=1 Tax=Dokdonella sp. TaxID=2291710 RepID=UPI0035293F9B